MKDNSVHVEGSRACLVCFYLVFSGSVCAFTVRVGLTPEEGQHWIFLSFLHVYVLRPAGWAAGFIDAIEARFHFTWRRKIAVYFTTLVSFCRCSRHLIGGGEGGDEVP